MKIKYEYGAVSVFFVSLGFALILIGLNKIDLLGFFSVILLLFGTYTIIYGLMEKENTYYYVWGSIMFVIGLSLLFYNLIPLPVLIGITIIIITLIGFFSYIKQRKS
jgi:hypothetical protein